VVSNLDELITTDKHFKSHNIHSRFLNL